MFLKKKQDYITPIDHLPLLPLGPDGVQRDLVAQPCDSKGNTL